MGAVEMDVEVLDGIISIDDKALQRTIAPEAIALSHKRNLEACAAAAEKVG